MTRLEDLATGTLVRGIIPDAAAALLFANEPLRWIPGAYIQFVRWAGTTMSDNPAGTKKSSAVISSRFYARCRRFSHFRPSRIP